MAKQFMANTRLMIGYLAIFPRSLRDCLEILIFAGPDDRCGV